MLKTPPRLIKEPGSKDRKLVSQLEETIMFVGVTPASVATAVENVNSILHISNKASLVHTKRRKEATATGVRYYYFRQILVDDLKRGVSAAEFGSLKNGQKD